MGEREQWARWARLAEASMSLARAGWRAGYRPGLLNPEVAKAMLRRGIGPRSVHALYAATAGDRIAIEDRRRRLTYTEADREVDAFGHALREGFGAGPNRPVLLGLENRCESLTAWFGCMRAGVPCAHASPHATEQELAAIVRRLAPAVVVTSSIAEASVRRACAGTRTRVLDVDRERPDVRASGAHSRSSTGDNIVFTSGTTGVPKAAVRDLAGLHLVDLLGILERLPLRVGDRHLLVAPMYHSSGQAFSLLNTGLGASIAMVERFDPLEVLRQLSEGAFHSVFMVPTMIRRILDLPDEVRQRWPTPDLRALVSGAAPFDPPLRRRAIAQFGPGAVFDFYGATELGWVTLVDGHEMTAKPGSLGRALRGQEIAIFDEQGQQLGPLARGTVYTRSSQMIRGYLHDERATATAKRGAWMTVDDLGYLDADGSLFLTGRARDMVISGGVNLYPVEIEHVLAEHPSIAEVAVIGVPDPRWGESLVAVVVPRATFDATAVEAWARTRLQAAKVPRRFELVDALPRNPTGKVLKRALEQRFA